METWVCPNDRQLALRAKLGAGWSVHSTKNTPFGKSERLTSEETEKILKVIKQAEKLEQVEMSRIGHLVDKFEIMRNNASGNGKTQCLLCGEEFGLMGASPAKCYDCNKCTCSKCGVDTVNSKARSIHLCKICSESRELWRKSGAWFYKGLPGFIRPQNSKGHASLNSSLRVPNRSLRSSPNKGLDSAPLNNNQYPATEDTNSTAHLARHPMPSFARFPKNKANSDSSDDDEVNIIRKKVRPQESESDSDNPLTNSELKRVVNVQSDRGANVEQPIREQASRSADDLTSTTTLSANSTDSLPGINNNNNDNNNNNNNNNNNDNNYNNSNRRGPMLLLTSRPQLSLDHVTSDEDPGSLPETPASLGMLEFSLHYHSKDKLLKCIVHRAKNLPAMDKNGFSDPYVKLHLLPGVVKSTKRRTKTIHKSKNPEWNETIEYHGVTEQDLKNKTLRFSIFDEDMVGSDFIGETRVNLKSLVPDLTREFSVYLSGLQVRPGEEEDDHKSSDRGRILMGLMYTTVGEKLIVSVKRCTNLIAMDSNGLSDPYVKIYLKPDKDKKTKNKTKVKAKTLNPIFNEEFYYPVKLAELTKKTLEVSVWDKDFGKNDFIGSVEFGPDAGMAELRHWLDVLKKPNEMVEHWHVLRVPNVNKSSQPIE